MLCGRHKTDNNRNCSVILPREFTTTMIWFPWALTLKIWWLAFPSCCYIVHISLQISFKNLVLDQDKNFYLITFQEYSYQLFFFMMYTYGFYYREKLHVNHLYNLEGNSLNVIFAPQRCIISWHWWCCYQVQLVMGIFVFQTHKLYCQKFSLIKHHLKYPGQEQWQRLCFSLVRLVLQ